MQIKTHNDKDFRELEVSGRLDAEWADTLQQAIEEALREGAHSLLLDLSQVVYMSSAGLGVLVRAQKQFQRIRGSFGVKDVDGPVGELIRLTGLSKLLLWDAQTFSSSIIAPPGAVHSVSRMVYAKHADFTVYDLEPKATMDWSVIGNPARLESGQYEADDAAPTEITESTIALGLAAFTEEYTDQQASFGEMLALAGTVAVQPAGKSQRADYQSIQGEFRPQPEVLYGIKLAGSPSHLLRFDINQRDRSASLTDLVDEAMEAMKYEAAGVVFLAETSGLVGATLRRLLTERVSGDSRFDHPEIREWLSFAPERIHANAVVAIVGVALRATAQDRYKKLLPFVRPMRSSDDLLGHFHAAVFPFQPFKKRKLDLNESVGSLFSSGQLQAVMHLLNDDRPISGAGDSEFVRGACWISPLASAGPSNAKASANTKESAR
jgi:anti-anti-sigma factor